MRSAKRRKEVVKSVFIGQIDCCQLNADLVSIAVEQVVVSDGKRRTDFVERYVPDSYRRFLFRGLGRG
jgi:hypothetical protein